MIISWIILYRNFDPSKNGVIAIIRQYLCGVAGNDGISHKQFLKKFTEITKKLRAEMYDDTLTVSVNTPIAWDEIELTTCGCKEGQWGPSLTECIEEYNTKWCRNKKLFNVRGIRRGIQILTIPQSGMYAVSAWGAGNYFNTGSGTEFESFFSIVYNYLKFRERLVEYIFLTSQVGSGIKYGKVFRLFFIHGKN